MLQDRLLKLKWRIFVAVLYIVMFGSIIARLFPITERFKNMLNILQVWSAVCFVIFALIYYKRPEWVRREED